MPLLPNKPAQPATPADPYAAFVQTGTVGGHAPEGPPAYAEGVSSPPADDPYASYAGDNQPVEENYSTQLLKGVPGAAKSVGKGLLEGAGSTLNNLRQFIPGSKGTPEQEQKIQSLLTPGDSGESFGKGLEQGGEFLIPGLGEEKAASLLPDLKYAKPLGRIAYNALTTGAVNKAQGGTFTGGAEAGVGGGILGEGMRVAAPALAEKAIGIRGKFDRSFNKEPGRALLDETRGINPENISKQAGERIGDLSGQVEGMADQASVKPNPVRGLLPAPPQEIPLATTPGRNPRMSPMAFDAKINPHVIEGAPDAGSLPGAQSEIGSEIPAGNQRYSYGIPNPHYLSGGAHPELSGRVPETQGVLLRPAEGDSSPLPSMVPNRTASLAPARSAVTGAMGTAANRNAEGTFNQLQGMGKTLHQNFLTHEPIPENVTPRQLLDLRRGFNDEYGRWNPELHEPTVSAGRQAYGALTNEFHNVLPEAKPLDTRISNLIPVKNRAQIAGLNDNVGAKVLGRVGAHTGALAPALAGAGIGGYGGYQHGGAEGAVLGGLTGAVVPELIASPRAQLLGARLFNNPGKLTRPLGGAILNLGRNSMGEEEEGH